MAAPADTPLDVPFFWACSIVCVRAGGSAENDNAGGVSEAPGSVLAIDLDGSTLPSEGLGEMAKVKEAEEVGGVAVV